MTYAATKGRASHKPATATTRPAPPPLSEADQQRVAANRAFVLEHLPELPAFIKDLHAEGLIDGWRNITHCNLIEK